MAAASSNDNNEQPQPHPLYQTSRLSHVMLKVPSVDRTVAYWTEQMGDVLISKHNDKGAMTSAFVALGNGTSTENGFALELVQHSSSSPDDADKFQLGTAISYIGVSMLLQFQNNLLGAAAGEKPQEQGDEPNGIAVKSSASAPGDFFCRFCLTTPDLVSTNAFYSEVMGMDPKAIDANMICMRYDNNPPNKNGDGDSAAAATNNTTTGKPVGGGYAGVPTTLVFEKVADTDIDMGNCFDHIAIVTTRDIGDEYERIRTMIADGKATGATIFMNPTEMFGKKVMGIRDPNGYKVILASE
jgi:catechol 2,3-dioxygenase-like lactoylglutathione lyase family enzyme